MSTWSRWRCAACSTGRSALYDYEACLLSLASGDADPNADMNVWLSSGPTHPWNPQRPSPATAWEAEIDGLMRRQMVYSIPLRYGAPHQDAADIFQRVCLDLFNELPRLRDAEALQGWLIRVTTHKCYHWKRRQSSLESQWDENDLAARSADLAAPPDMVAGMEREQLVQEAIAQLPPRCREMI